MAKFRSPVLTPAQLAENDRRMRLLGDKLPPRTPRQEAHYQLTQYNSRIRHIQDNCDMSPEQRLDAATSLASTMDAKIDTGLDWAQSNAFLRLRNEVTIMANTLYILDTLRSGPYMTDTPSGYREFEEKPRGRFLKLLPLAKLREELGD